ncbi:nucleotidyltransferase domain-containing protein [Candidatus Aminicenantes bacterium AC-335-B20]|jgi:hypothetical protein|nr:nucleotidyltransferase domain-containing protein [SCandidatus Aminicenantes bacterium Aminicenantia_JdfR_composite]MCP2596700.1 nucleotidyltransferase domain-containing protein [Candidatus Aminicenantes bacterium AC-335-G13]MCP2598943.1 nucleotidyltransferase domain-containing protein [Candidatus Aminicenantes bacterium AC-335-B20]
MIKRKKITQDINPLLSELKNKLEKEKDIVFAYIFGSYGKGKISPLSDIDIGIYIEPQNKIWDRKLELLTLISEVLKTDEIDLVILNEATPFLIYSVLNTGKLLFSKDEIKRISFLVKKLKEFLDFGYHRLKMWEGMKKRIKEGRFGF